MEALTHPRQHWYDIALVEVALMAERFGQSKRSTEWSLGHLEGGKPGDFFRRALVAARNLARHQGVPPKTQIQFTSVGEVGVGAAGFWDAPESFERPFILLDQAPYQLCQSDDEALDVYCGIALHEAGHILFTREGYRDRAEEGRAGLLNDFANVFEDDRVEALLCRSSPGYAPYIFAARKKLLYEGPIGQALQDWDRLPDLDKVLALIVSYVRAPHCISQKTQQWQAINGECVFRTLRDCLSHPPQTEADVARLAQWCYDFFERLKALYHGDDRSQDAVPDADQRRAQQQAADAEDQANGVNRGSRFFPTSADPEALRQKHCPGSSRPSAKRPRPRRRFSSDRRKGTAAESETPGCGPEASSKAASSEGDTRPEEEKPPVEEEFGHDQWTWQGKSRSVIVQSVRTIDAESQERYQRSRRRIAGLIPATKAVVPAGSRTRHLVKRERSRGSVDPRRIALAEVSPRVFQEQSKTDRTGISLGLLIDASGSMSVKAELARDAAVLLAEAFADHPRVTLRVYSHTTRDMESTDCIIRIHYGHNQKSLAGLGTYQALFHNYDHCAIAKCNELLRASARSGDQRLLVVICDGLPEGVDYSGASAIAATHQAVQQARAGGTHVLGIGIGRYNCHKIFGERWVLNVANCQELPRKLQALLAQVCRDESS